MRIIHGGGYSEEEKKGYKQQIYGNVYIAIQNLTNAMRKLKISFKSEENEVSSMSTHTTITTLQLLNDIDYYM